MQSKLISIHSRENKFAFCIKFRKKSMTNKLLSSILLFIFPQCLPRNKHPFIPILNGGLNRDSI